MSSHSDGRLVEILLVEDNPGDVRLTEEAMKEGKMRNNLSVAVDGVEAMAFLRREGKYADAPRPDVVLLDMRLPKANGPTTGSPMVVIQRSVLGPKSITGLTADRCDSTKPSSSRCCCY